MAVGQTDIIQLKGIGEKTAKLFYKLNIRTVGELLQNYPRDYETFSPPLFTSDITSGELCSIRACLIGNITSKKVRNLTVTNFAVKDGTGEVFMTYFNMPYVKNIVKKGISIYSGESRKERTEGWKWNRQRFSSRKNISN